MPIHHLPTLNASLNGLAGIFLVLGFIAIKSGNKDRHRKLMMAAFITSTLFLISYLTYHFLSPGVTKYQKEGFIRNVYFFVLISHTILAAIVPPAAILAVWHAVKGNFPKHTRITRWLFPVWTYVSFTGVTIYLMLYIF